MIYRQVLFNSCRREDEDRTSSCLSEAIILCFLLLVAGLSGWDSTIPLIMCSTADKLRLFVIAACQKSCCLWGWCLHSPILQLSETTGISCQLFHVKFTQDALLLCLCFNQKGLTCLGCTAHSLLHETTMRSCHLLSGVDCESNFESRSS